MFRSIRWRIAVPYVILVVIGMLGMDIYLSYLIRQTYLDNLTSQMSAVVRLIGDRTNQYLDFENKQQDFNEIARHYSDLLNMRVTIIATDGTVLGESNTESALMDNHLNRPEVVLALHEGLGINARFSKTVGYSMMYAAVAIQSNGQTAGIVRIAYPLELVEKEIKKSQLIAFGITLLVAIAAVGLAALIASRTTRPLLDLTQAVEQMTEGERIHKTLLPVALDEVGTLTRAFNTLTVQLRAQMEALEGERDKLAAVLREMTDGVLIVDDQSRLVMINPAAEKLFSVVSERVIGHSLVEVLRSHFIVELWENCRQMDKTQTAQFDMTEKHIYLEVTATPLGQALPGSTLLVIQNLTHQHKLEAMRRDFISNISHELRTPLASLKALTETLQEGALDDPPTAHHFLERIETEVDSLSLMVSELLELSRIESGKVPFNFIAVNPIQIIIPAVERLRLQSERAGLELKLDCPDDLPNVRADPHRLEQVLVNLLHNAIKFTGAGGKIEVSARLKNTSVLFSVRDTGIGIPKEDLDRIFERFFKIDRARSGGGTGLGLSIARHIVEAHKGKIWVDSVQREGSTFSFTIPLFK